MLSRKCHLNDLVRFGFPSGRDAVAHSNQRNDARSVDLLFAEGYRRVRLPRLNLTLTSFATRARSQSIIETRASWAPAGRSSVKLVIHSAR
jgi:hypothetical protein